MTIVVLMSWRRVAAFLHFLISSSGSVGSKQQSVASSANLPKFVHNSTGGFSTFTQSENLQLTTFR